MARKRECQRCGDCCRYVTVQVTNPKAKEDYSTLFWYLLHENVNVFIDEDGDWFVEFVTPCVALEKTGCKIHALRPKVCRGHDPDECEKSEDEDPYEACFHTPEELEKYLEDKGVDFRYKRGGY